MPRLEKKRLPVLTAEQLKQIVNACNVRDKAIVLFLVDSGLRRAEVVSLSWADVDMTSGLVRVKRGKGKKDRSAVIGATTRRALLAYRRTLADREGYCCKPTKAGALHLAALFVSSSDYPSGLGYTSQLTPYAGPLLFCHFAMG